MASYVDNNFRQAVMKNPVDRSPQVFLSSTSLKTSIFLASESPPLLPIPFPSTVEFVYVVSPFEGDPSRP